MPSTTVPWGNRYRLLLLKSSFVLLWVGFALAYIGSTNNNEPMIMASFVTLGLACLLPILAKK